MTKDTVKNAIKKKFGKFSAFARATGLDRYELQKTFARKEVPKDELKKLHELCRTTDVATSGGTVDPEKIERLKKAIDTYGGAYKFCKDHPQFKERQVYNLLKNLDERTNESELLMHLFKHFEIE